MTSCRYESPWQISPTASQIDAIELVQADYHRLFKHLILNDCPIDPDTGELLPAVMLATDNGGPFRSFRFETLVAQHPELHHVRTRGEITGPGRLSGVRLRFDEFQRQTWYDSF